MSNYSEQMKELTTELFKALDVCKVETINDALQLSKFAEETSLNEKEQIVRSILHHFGPKRFVNALESTPGLLPSIYQTCQLPASSTTEDLLQHIDKLEVYPFLNGFLPENKHFLRAICDALGLPERETAEDMIKSIADEIMLGGSENFLSSLPKEILEKFAIDLSVAVPLSVEHDKLVDMLMVKIFELEPYDAFQKLLHGESEDEEEYDVLPPPPPPPNKKRKRTPDQDDDNRKAKKVKGKYVCPPLENIKKGISSTDLRDLYNVTDLQEWCRQQGIASSGLKKSILIKTILQYLDTGVAPKAASKRGKAKGKGKRRK